MKINFKVVKALAAIAMIILLVMAFSGCAWDTKIIHDTKVIAPEDSLIIDCPIATPPNKEAYVAADMKGREGMLVDYSSTLMKNCIVCNQRFSALRKWKTDSVNVVQKKE